MDIKSNGSQLSRGFGVTLMKLVAATIMSLSLLASESSEAMARQVARPLRRAHQLKSHRHSASCEAVRNHLR